MSISTCDTVTGCVRDTVLSLLSLLTSGFLGFAIYRRHSSRHGHSYREASILLLSILQTSLCGYYSMVGEDDGFLVFTARIMKVLQSLAIGWMFLVAIESFHIVGHTQYAHIGCSLLSGLVLFYYVLTTFLWMPSREEALCRDSTWVAVSATWFVASLIVSSFGTYWLRNVSDAGVSPRILTTVHDAKTIELVADHNPRTLDSVAIICDLTRNSSGSPSVDLTATTTNEGNVCRPSAHDAPDATAAAALSSGAETLQEPHPLDDSNIAGCNTAEPRIPCPNSPWFSLAALPQTLFPSYKRKAYTLVSPNRTDSTDILQYPARSFPSPTDLQPCSSLTFDPSVVAGRTQIGRKKRHLLSLIVIDAIAAGITMIWDLIIWMSSAPASSDVGGTTVCTSFLSHSPPLESVFYVFSRTVSLLVPHWAIFVVFYWMERALYRPYSKRWDIDLHGVEHRQQELDYELPSPQ